MRYFYSLVVAGIVFLVAFVYGVSEYEGATKTSEECFNRFAWALATPLHRHHRRQQILPPLQAFAAIPAGVKVNTSAPAFKNLAPSYTEGKCLMKRGFDAELSEALRGVDRQRFKQLEYTGRLAAFRNRTRGPGGKKAGTAARRRLGSGRWKEAKEVAKMAAAGSSQASPTKEASPSSPASSPTSSPTNSDDLKITSLPP